MKDGTSSRRIAGCACCGTEGPIKGRGLTYACYLRHWKAGTINQFPTTSSPKLLQSRREWARKGWEANSHIRAGRVEDYADLRSLGESQEQAAARLGVTMRTARRYERTLREQVSA